MLAFPGPPLYSPTMIFPPKIQYGLQIAIELAQHEGRVRIQDIAELQGLSGKYVEAIITDLRKGGFAKSVRGRLGGYTLAKPAKDISVGQIVRCLGVPYMASEDPKDGPLEFAMEKTLAAAWNTLDRMTLAKIVQKKRR